MTDPRTIAAGLTAAQKRALLDAEDMMSNHGGYPFLTVRLTSEPWPMGLAEFLTLKTDRLTPPRPSRSQNPAGARTWRVK